MEIQQAELGNDTINANAVKDLVLYRLQKDGVISESVADNYSEKWQVVILKNAWYKNWVKKFNKNKDAWTYGYLNFED